MDRVFGRGGLCPAPLTGDRSGGYVDRRTGYVEPDLCCVILDWFQFQWRTAPAHILLQLAQRAHEFIEVRV